MVPRRVEIGIGLLFLALSIAGLVYTLLGLGLITLDIRIVDPWAVQRLPRRIGIITSFLLFGYIGLALLEGRPRSVLFLRRFGRNWAILSPRGSTGLGRRIRLVTLDDSRFRAAAVPRLDWWLSSFAPPAIAVLIVILGAGTARSWLGTFDESNDSTYIYFSYFFAFWAWMLWVVLLMLIMHRRRLFRTAMVHVTTKEQLALVADRLRSATRWWSRPGIAARRATVVSCTDEMWRAAVVTFASRVDAIVIDVSFPSENLIWESQQLAEMNIPTFYIADAEQRSDSAVNNPEDHSAELRIRLHKAIGEKTTAKYVASKAAELRRFRRNLTDAILRSPLERRRRPARLTPPGPVRARLTRFYSSRLLIAAATGLIVSLVVFGVTLAVVPTR
jgi:hypothetical protein